MLIINWFTFRNIVAITLLAYFQAQSAFSDSSSLYPSDLDSVAKQLCQSINLNYPGLEIVKKKFNDGEYSAALETWRDFKVTSLRRAYLGPFGWHNNQINSTTVLPYALYLAGKITPDSFQTSLCEFRYDLPPFKFAGSPYEKPHFNWFPKNTSGEYITRDVYAGFGIFIPLTAQYFKSGETIYLDKWFQILGEFACRQKLELGKLDPSIQKTMHCNWSTYAGQALSQAGRVKNIIKGLGVVCKSLPDGGKPVLWDTVFYSNNNQLPPESMKMVAPIQLAQIAFSLVFDHPDALMNRYLTAGAVPNQRLAGLHALLMIALQFPEFSRCGDIFSKATVAIDDYLQGAISADGTMLEQSFNYNQGDAGNFDEMILFLQKDFPDLANRIREKQFAFYRFSAALRTPVGAWPAMSSQGPCNPPPIWRDTVAKKTFLTSISKALPGQNDSYVATIADQFLPHPTLPAPEFTSIRFPYGGYYVQRKSWRWDSYYMFFQDGRPQRGHTNRGNNAIQIWAFGRPLLISAGVPVYDSSQLTGANVALRSDINAINQLMGEETSLKTNTVIIDGKSQSRGIPAQTVYMTPIDRRWHKSENFDFCEGYFDLGYPIAGKVNHRRMVIFVSDPGFWIVTDIMSNLDSASHTYSQIWNFPGFQASGPSSYGFKQNEVITTFDGIHTSDPEGPNIWMYHIGEKRLKYSTFFGQKNPYLGWYRPGFSDLMPAPQIFCEWTCSKNSVLVTIIWPVNNSRAPEFSNLVNLSDTTDPSFANFILTLADGREVNYQVSHDCRSLSNDYTRSISAQSSLTIRLTNGRIHGLTAGFTNKMPSVNEYTWENGQLASTTPFFTINKKISAPSKGVIQKMEIYDISGKKVFTKRYQRDNTDFYRIPAGIYIIKKITSNRNEATHTIILKTAVD